MKSKRIEWLDFAKGFTILWVVLAHCISNAQFINHYIFAQYVSYFSFLFVMPMFFVISGFLYKGTKSKHDYLLLIYKKGISLLIPYFIIAMIYFIFDSFIKHNYSVLNIIFAPRVDVSLWFLPSLFIMFLLVGLFDLLHIKRYILYGVSVIILFLSSSFWKYANNTNQHHTWEYLMYSYLFFFCVGLFIKKHKAFLNKTFTTKLYSMSYLILCIISLVIELSITVRHYQNNCITVSNIIPKLLSVFALFTIFINLHHNTKFFKYFTKYGKYTLIIYLVHFSFEFTVYNTGIVPPKLYGFVLLFIVTWLVSILVCHLALKYKLIDFIFYPRKYINKLLIKTKLGKYLFN